MVFSDLPGDECRISSITHIDHLCHLSEFNRQIMERLRLSDTLGGIKYSGP
jgi:hypothetical protein